jgi:hypothetical protein
LFLNIEVKGSVCCETRRLVYFNQPRLALAIYEYIKA